MRIGVLALLFAGERSIAGPDPVAARPVTARDIVESTRIVGERRWNSWNSRERQPVSVSPDGRRYVLRTARGDLASNSVRMDILSGSMASLAAAASPTLVATLTTPGLGDRDALVGADLDPLATNQIQWLSNDRIAFLWSDGRGIRQIVTIGLDDRQVRFVTAGPKHVGLFQATPDGTFLFNRLADDETARSLDAVAPGGFSLDPRTDIWSLVNGRVETSRSAAFNRNRWFLQRAGEAPTDLAILGAQIERGDVARRSITLSPDGRLALLPTGTRRRPLVDWSYYRDPILHGYLAGNGEGFVSAYPLNYVLIDLRTKTTSQLWDAPRSLETTAAWSPDSARLALAQTFLPGARDGPGNRGDAAAILDPASGRVVVLAIDLQGRSVTALRWGAGGEVELTVRTRTEPQARTYRFSAASGALLGDAPASATPVTNDAGADPIAFRLVEDLNSFPQLFAEDRRTGERRLVLDPNLALRRNIRLGATERIEGELPGVGRWAANVMYPPTRPAGARLPLVIQGTYGVGAPGDGFSLNGDQALGTGLGPPLTASFPGHALAAQGMVVAELSVQWAHSPTGIEEAEANRDAYVALAEALVGRGVVDRTRVGLAGFSRTGYFVEYTLTHSDFPFAAAMVADNYSTTYTLAALRGWLEFDNEDVGAAPFGAGLEQWIRNSAGFNYYRIRTPTLMIGQSTGVRFFALSKWELYSILRRNGVCTEMYFMPDMERHPSHGPQNPRQILAVQERVIAWFTYYLQRNNGQVLSRPCWQARSLPQPSP